MIQNRELDKAADLRRGEQVSKANRPEGRPRFKPGEAGTEGTQLE